MSVKNLRFALNAAAEKQRELAAAEEKPYLECEHPLADKIREEIGDFLNAYLYAQRIHFPDSTAYIEIRPYKNSKELEIRYSAKGAFDRHYLEDRSYVLTSKGYNIIYYGGTIGHWENFRGKTIEKHVSSEEVVQDILNYAYKRGPRFLQHFRNYLSQRLKEKLPEEKSGSSKPKAFPL